MPPASRTVANRNKALADTGSSYRSPAALIMQPAHLDLIEQSHQRCAALGLSRIERPD